MAERIMSMNGYAWVEGNVIKNVDPSGYLPLIAALLNQNACFADTNRIAMFASLQNPLSDDPCGCEWEYYASPPSSASEAGLIRCLHNCGSRSCPRIPQTGRLQSWEAALLHVASASEYRLTALNFDPIDMARLAYGIAWIILNRLTSPCWRQGTAHTIAQLAFGGTALRNSTVYGLGTFDIALSELLVPNPIDATVSYVADYGAIAQSAAREDVRAVQIEAS